MAYRMDIPILYYNGNTAVGNMRAAVGLWFVTFMVLANVCPPVWGNPHTVPEYTGFLNCTACIRVI